MRILFLNIYLETRSINIHAILSKYPAEGLRIVLQEYCVVSATKTVLSLRFFKIFCFYHQKYWAWIFHSVCYMSKYSSKNLVRFCVDQAMSVRLLKAELCSTEMTRINQILHMYL